jgi:hypothetical protein
MSFDADLADAISSFYADPLGYVMFVYPWDTDKAIQVVKLIEPWKSRYQCEFGPDVWACQFLDDLGEEIRKRGFTGQRSVEPIRYATASGHGIGKSVMVAWLIKFILDTRPFAKGVVTANTSDQLRTKTWAELGKWHKLSLTEHWYDYSSGRGSMSLARKGYKEIWRCDAQTCREENSEAFQGLHAANSTPFYIFDEASGIPEKIWEARAGGATDGEPMSFDFGNATRNTGMFFENCVGKFRHRYTVRSIDSRSVQITNKALMQEWVDDYGEESDFVKVKVRGMFPAQSSVQFINSDDVRMAQARPAPVDNKAPLIIGVDVARFGDDDTVIYPRVGMDAKSWEYERYNGLDTTQVTGKVIQMVERFRGLGKNVSAIFVDGGAMGGGVIDQLRQLGYSPVEVQFGTRPPDPRYRYRGDNIWGNLRDNVSKLALPNDEALFAEMTQREYGFTTGGKMHLETKADMKKRGVKSPDVADALALTFASPINQAGLDTAPRSYVTDYDPLKG